VVPSVQVVDDLLDAFQGNLQPYQPGGAVGCGGTGTAREVHRQPTAPMGEIGPRPTRPLPRLIPKPVLDAVVGRCLRRSRRATPLPCLRRRGRTGAGPGPRCRAGTGPPAGGRSMGTLPAPWPGPPGPGRDPGFRYSGRPVRSCGHLLHPRHLPGDGLSAARGPGEALAGGTRLPISAHGQSFPSHDAASATARRGP